MDLLRERRIELGLPAQPAPFVPTRLLLRRGVLLGGAVLLMSGAITAALNWRGQQQEQQLEALAPTAQRLASAEAQLRRLRTNTAAVNKETTRIAQQLVAFPGGSPLLEQLRRVTPLAFNCRICRLVRGRFNCLAGRRSECPQGLSNASMPLCSPCLDCPSALNRASR